MSSDDLPNDDKNRMAKEFFLRATKAQQSRNWEYAVEMWKNATKLVPDNQQFRIGLRMSQRQVYGDNGKGAKMSGMKLRGIRGKAKKAGAKENWKEMDHLAEEGLCVNPWDGQLLHDAGEACEQRGFNEIARINYKWAVEAEPENKVFLHSLARVLEALANYKEAISVWERLHKLDPMDSEARSKVTQLHAKTVMDRGGYEDADNTRDVKTEDTKSAYDDFDPASGRKQEEASGPGVSLEADLQRAIRKSPEAVEPYIKLAEYYRNRKQYEQSRENYQQALQVSGGDSSVREMLEDVELEMLKQNYELAKQELAKQAANAEQDEISKENAQVAKENVQALGIELLKREIAVYTSRVEKYPRDNRYKLELGKRLIKAKHHEKAIPHLQKASADSRLVAEVGVMLGKCFMAVNKGSLAINSFKRALPEINTHDQEELYCDAHYCLGFLHEKKKDFATAEEHYTEVIGVNYEYRDTLKRLETIQEAGEPQGD